MLGFGLSFAVAVCKAATDVSFKLAGRHVPHDDVLLLVQRTVEACLGIGAILLVYVLFAQTPALSALATPYFALLLLSSVVLNGLALYLNIKALRISDVSVVSPMSQLTPAILLITSPLMLGESVSLIGGAGVLLVVAGSYCIGMSGFTGQRFSLTRPLYALAKDTGVRLALASSVLYGITSNIDKLGVQASDPYVWTASTAIILTAVLGAGILLTNCSRLTLTGSQLGSAVIPGFTSGIGSIIQMIAISIWAVPYVIAIKRLSSLFSIITGGLLFKEKNIGWRLVGALIMVGGTALILIYG